MIKKNVFHSFLMFLLVLTGPGLIAQTNQISTPNQLKSKPIPVASFKHGDIGNPSINGIVKLSENGFDITAGGVDIWGVKD